ncbi:hypothetical protein BT96DRAFT_561763 [Gymnopus androsaceus JB14]|uniref:Uncharacterized protein n=1 Tax=Gymnopus androsaceus JB14 TaxID=1447944 RepID=A0A6A4GKS2_9AGAR|nr:hypothetical protein BT96DRAFT_561763 [Gymnopus androsaceus JB14]
MITANREAEYMMPTLGISQPWPLAEDLTSLSSTLYCMLFIAVYAWSSIYQSMKRFLRWKLSPTCRFRQCTLAFEPIPGTASSHRDLCLNSDTEPEEPMASRLIAKVWDGPAKPKYPPLSSSMPKYSSSAQIPTLMTIPLTKATISMLYHPRPPCPL